MDHSLFQSPHPLKAQAQAQVQVQVYRHEPQGKAWTYPELDRYQRQVAQRLSQGEPGVLILSELAPVITLGRRTLASHLLVPHGDLARRGVEVYPTDRGGLATYHGPGQWVLFPVMSLEQLTGDPRGVRTLVDLLLQIALEVGSQYLPHVEVRGGAEQGVWTQAGKFAAVGVHVDQGVVLHGLSINGFKTPESFYGIKPCGLEAPVSYLLPEPDEVSFQELGCEILKRAQQRLLRA